MEIIHPTGKLTDYEWHYHPDEVIFSSSSNRTDYLSNSSLRKIVRDIAAGE
jgi:hypothetical protein